MSKQVQNQEEEIDLGGFFNQIGKLFLKLFKLIGGLLQFTYHTIIVILIFIRQQYIKLSIAFIIGLTLGIIYVTNIPDTYKYDMIVQPNFDGAYQLNERIQYYNQLIDKKDYESLSKLFSIDRDDAKSIQMFELKRMEELEDIYEGYDKFIRNKDSITISKIPFEKYANKNFSYFNSEKYVFRMLLKKKNLKKNIQKEIITDLENNKHLIEQRDEKLKRLNEREKNIIKLMHDIDTIRATDKKIALTAALNGNINATNIDVNKETKTDNKDISMFNIFKDATLELDNILSEKEKFNSIYRIITPFEPLGKAEKGLLSNKILKITILILLLTTFSILFKPLIQYLDNYKKNRSSK